MAGRAGGLALVLHSHMPYVEGFGTWPFGEEWLWEAAACVYTPLLEVIDGAPVTVGLTPVLCDQLEAMSGDAGDRYLRFLAEIRAPLHAEDARGLELGGEAEAAAEVRRAAADYSGAAQDFERRGRDLPAAFAALRRVELWTSAASHAILPLLATDAGLRLQLRTGVAAHTRRFGGWGGGFWLPECAYVPGLERELADAGVEAFCVDQTRAHGLGAAAQLEPVRTPAGPVAVPIDWQTVELVWNEERGYPGHGTYRDYHRRTVHDLKPWDNAGRPYDHGAALALAAAHARDFVSRARTRLSVAACSAARSTPSCSATGGTRARPGWRPCSPSPIARGCRWSPSPRGCVWSSRWSGRLSPRAGGRARTWSPGTRRPWPSSPSAPGGRSCSPLRPPRPGPSPGSPSSGRRASCWRSRPATGPSWPPATLAADYPLERFERHSATHDAALAALADSAPVPEPQLRNLAPDLDLASLTTP